MQPLDLKLIRDLGGMKGQAGAIALVMACGLAVMIMARSLIISLESARDTYYAAYRLADVFCDLSRAPNAVRSRLAEIPGVGVVETRVAGSLTIDLPERKEPVNGKILSLPEDRLQRLNLVFLRTGRLPESGHNDEVVVSEPFAQANQLGLGDSIDATIHGARQRLRIVGLGLSPEYVYATAPGDGVPDDRRYGIFWMNEPPLARALLLEGAFNNFAAELAPTANKADVLAEIDRVLTPYGGLIAYDRGDQPSAKQISDRIRVLGAFALVFPAVFLGIAAFMSSAVLTRLIRLQREQIAQLKALGYSSRQIGWHYLKFALVIVLLGTVLGSLLGLWLGDLVVIVYRRFFHFPALPFCPDWTALLLALVASAAASIVGVAGAVNQAMSLPAAEAMRPEPPAEFRPSIIERFGLQTLVASPLRMAMRNLERKPWHALLTMLGLAFATGIPLVPGAIQDGITYLSVFVWELQYRQDVTVHLTEPTSARVLNDIRNLPGVMVAEPLRDVAARLRYQQHERRVEVSGVPQTSSLHRLLDENAVRVQMPLSGLVLSAKLAEVLGVTPGDSVQVEVEEGERPTFQAVVAGVITDFTGLFAYMDIDVLRELMREGGTITGADLAVDGAHWDELMDRVKQSPRVGSFTVMRDSRASFDQTTTQMMGAVQTIYFSFAVIVSFGVVYNSARIALSERARELATLRVLGFTYREVATILMSELAILTLVAIPVGLWIGIQFAALIVHAANTESVRMPLVLEPRAFVVAIIIVLIASGVSFAIVGRRIRQLDLLSVLKARE
jgi:putative ABC transport system permease protein